MPQPPEERIANIVLAEGASEGPDGMAFILDTMVNRAKSRKLSLEQVATQSAVNKKGVRVYQYTGAGRKDLESFAAKQPPILKALAMELVRERMQPDYHPQYPDIEHYVTTDFYEHRAELPPDHWVNQMEPAQRVGKHLGLVPKKKKK